MQFMRTHRRCGFTLLWSGILLLFAMPGLARVEQKVGTFAGVNITYRVLLPNDYDPAKAYPTVLHFAGGSQDSRIVQRSTEADWRTHAEQHGYVVISPAAPDGELYFEGAERIFPAFFDHILRSYNVLGGKLHVTGHSNGGLSAFHVASLYPQYVYSVTGYPGLLGSNNPRQMAALKPLCLYMHVGDQDLPWLAGMEAQYKTLRARGYRIQFRIETDQAHRLDTSKDDLANRLLAELEEARNGCGGT